MQAQRRKFARKTKRNQAYNAKNVVRPSRTVYTPYKEGIRHYSNSGIVALLAVGLFAAVAISAIAFILLLGILIVVIYLEKSEEGRYFLNSASDKVERLAREVR